MFVYLTWENKGNKFKSMLQVHKALKIADEMKKLGVEPTIIFESTCAPKALAKNKA